MSYLYYSLVLFTILSVTRQQKACENVQCDEIGDAKRFSTDLGMMFCNSSCQPYITGKYPCCHLCCFDSVLKNVNGSWSEWGSWTSCSTTCDGGVRSRGRSCTNPYPSGNGTACLDKHLQRTFNEVHSEKCLLDKCAAKLDNNEVLLITLLVSSLVFSVFMIVVIAKYCRKGNFQQDIHYSSNQKFSEEEETTLVLTAEKTNFLVTDMGGQKPLEEV